MLRGVRAPLVSQQGACSSGWRLGQVGGAGAGPGLEAGPGRRGRCWSWAGGWARSEGPVLAGPDLQHTHAVETWPVMANSMSLAPSPSQLPSKQPSLLEVAWEGSCSGKGSQASAQTGEKAPSHPTPNADALRSAGGSVSLSGKGCCCSPLSVLVSLGCHYKMPQAGWLKLQKCISCGSGGWKVQDQGLQGSVSGENYFQDADGCLHRVLTWLRENSFLPFLQDHVPVD